MEQVIDQNIHSGDEIDKLTTSLVKSFFYNNSRLINALNEEIEKLIHYGSMYSKTLELKDGTVSVGSGSFSIYGYCLGSYVEFSGYIHKRGYYDIKIRNMPPLFGYVDLDYFHLNSYIELIESENTDIKVKFDKNHSLNYIRSEERRVGKECRL